MVPAREQIRTHQETNARSRTNLDFMHTESHRGNRTNLRLSDVDVSNRRRYNFATQMNFDHNRFFFFSTLLIAYLQIPEGVIYTTYTRGCYIFTYAQKKLSQCS